MTDSCVNDRQSLQWAMESQAKCKTVEGLLNEIKRLMDDIDPHTHADLPFDSFEDLQCDMVAINDDFGKAISNWEQGE